LRESGVVDLNKLLKDQLGPHTAVGPPARVRVHWLRVPVRTRSVFCLLFLIAMGFVVFALVVALLGSLGSAVELQDAVRATLMIAAVTVGAVVSLLTVRALDRADHRRLLRPTELRSQRLAKLASYSEAMAKLPHRWIERELRAAIVTPQRLKQLIKRLPPNTAIVAGDWAWGLFDQPTPSDIVFEPLEVGEWSDRLEDVATAVLPKSPVAKRDDQVSAERREGQVSGRFTRWTSALSSWLLAAITIFYMGSIVWGAIRGQRNKLFWLLFFIGLFFASWLFSLIVERKWWVIPGGLCLRESRLWRKHCRVARFSAEETPLLVYLPHFSVSILDGGKARLVQAEGPVLWVLLSTWGSRARSPSVAELHAYVTSQEA